ncbi:hypothetical protein P5G61_02865 [Paenibacillus sp. F6_3S_P_1C]|uniref:Uncharacterized protein n=1 Tax=Paenibacillus vandeheii TaxID=3035917 RepID=A0ABT8J581_9BACL|nr:hypothetical protein [Paenibacillus vandeheii]MDN4600157.1 hypothetical protein [Paenibacillus vandeheii]
MTIQKIVEELHQLIDQDWSKLDQAELKTTRETVDSLSNQLISEIDHTDNSDDLLEAINYELTNFFLPIPCVMKMYQRLILLNPASPSYYEWFTDYLLQYGPDWQEEANALTELYTKEDFQNACDFAQKIEKVKDFENK